MLNPLAALLLIPILTPAQFPWSTSSTTQQMTPNQQLTMKAKPAVVRIIAGCSGSYRDTRNGVEIPYVYNPKKHDDLKGITVGSGYFIGANGYIVTNAHMVESVAGSEQKCREHVERNLKAKLLKEQGLNEKAVLDLLDRNVIVFLKETFKDFQHVVLPNVNKDAEGEMFRFDVKKEGQSGADDGKDVAVIKIEVSDAPVLRFSHSNNVVKLQEPIIVIGYPGAADSVKFNQRSLLEATVTEGIVSNPNKALREGAPIIQLDALIEPGNSGSPVLNEKGEVIGMVTFRVDDNEGNRIPFAIPTSTIQEYVRQSGAESKEGSTDFLYREGLGLFWKGDYEGAKTKFQAVTALYPQHSEATRLIRESQEKIAQNLEGKDYTLWLFGLGGIVALLAGGYFLSRSRFAFADRFNGANGGGWENSSSPRHPHPSTGGPLQTLMNWRSRTTSAAIQPLLTLQNLQGKKQLLYLNKPRHQFGRDRDWADLLVPDDLHDWGVVSARHAIFEQEGNEYRVYDGSDRHTPSRNGLFVNGVAVSPQEGYRLKDGDQLKIGGDSKTQVTLIYSNPTVSSAARDGHSQANHRDS